VIENRQYRVSRRQIAEAGSVAAALERMPDSSKLLRWYVAFADANEVTIEATVSNSPLRLPDSPTRYTPGASAVVSVIPTGVGCAIGGYAGDAAPVSSLLAAACDYVITNPNAVNASNFIHLEPNLVYTEGSMIDLFCRGRADLHIPHVNRIGLIIERCSDDQLDHILNLVNAVRAVHGLDIAGYVVTNKRIGARCLRNESNAYTGSVDNPHVLLDAARILVQKGATAIAITSCIQDLPAAAYAQHFLGEDANPMGGVEAIMSHLIVNKFHVPAAHGPLVNTKALDLASRIVDARGAAEMASTSGLLCVLLGLRRAPQMLLTDRQRYIASLNIRNVLAVVAPAGCLGGIPMLYADRFGIPVIAVEENRTLLEVNGSDLGLSNVISVANYAEAAGVVLALRRGICLESIARPLQTLRPAGNEIKAALAATVAEGALS
jgi:Protein of unknown function (DUF3326)